MRLLGRFNGPNGEIAIMECRATGARHYEEGGVSQSCVLPGGDADVAYIRIMADLLEGTRVLLLGCGGGSLGSMLHRRGAGVTVVDVNPVSFQLARTFFWMPPGIKCITADMRAFLDQQIGRFDAIGIDVGGPSSSFSYRKVLDARTLARVCGALRAGGRVAVNISCEAPDDPIPGIIADKLIEHGLDVWLYIENAQGSVEVNAVVLGSARDEPPSALARIAEEGWSLAHLSN
jgi:SAM-dependent methyltransferase